MAQKSYKKIITATFVALALSVSALVATKTDAVFKGPDPVTNGRLVWSTDSGKTIRSANPDGTGVINMYNDPAASIMGDPVWSPDKSKIAFVIAKGEESGIYTINGTDANQTPVRLTTDNQDAVGTDPSWSPNGSKLIFARAVDGVSNIFVMDADGTDQIQLTDQDVDNDYSASRQAYDPQWSPVSGSKQIVFTVADPAGRPQDYPQVPSMLSNIHTAEMNVAENAFVADSDVELDGASWNASDGADKIRGEYDPQFSPDGSKVIFVRRTAGTAGNPNVAGSFSIGTALADNSSTVYTTVISSAKVKEGHSYLAVYDPAYSPDGKLISFEPKNNLLSIGPVKVFNVEAGTVSQYSGSGAEVDWTYAAEPEVPPTFDDVSITCTTEVGQPCTIEIPAYCTSELSTDPLHGTSVVTQNDDVTLPGSLTYTPAANPDGSYNDDEENYVHIRDNNVLTANCNVKIVFTQPDDPIVPNIPATGIIGGLVGVGLAAAVAGGLIYAKEYKNKKSKVGTSEK